MGTYIFLCIFYFIIVNQVVWIVSYCMHDYNNKFSESRAHVSGLLEVADLPNQKLRYIAVPGYVVIMPLFFYD